MATYEMQRNPNITFTPNTNAPPGQMGTNDLTAPTAKTITTQGSPSIGNNMGSVNATIAGILNQANAIQTQINEMSNAAKEQQAQASKQTESTGKAGVWDKIQGLIGQRQETQANQKSTEDIVNESMAKFGLTPETYQAMQGMIGQLSAFSAQMADLETKKQNAMDIIGNKSVDERYITQEQAVVAKRYDSQIASVSAQAGTVAYTLQLQQGLVKDAKETANMVIDAMTYDQKQKVADMDWAISTYSDLYDAMGKEEQQQWDNAHQIAQDEYQKALDMANLQLEQLKLNQTSTTTNPIGEDLDKRLATEISNLYSGRYGTEGAREKVISMLQSEFPSSDVSSLVYNRIPDGYEKQIKGSTPTLDQIKIDTENTFTQYKNAGYTRKQLEDQWLSDNKATELSPIIKDILDKLFPQGKKWWEFWK